MGRRWRNMLPRASVALLLVACSSQLRYQVMSSVLDGVPVYDAVGQDEVGGLGEGDEQGEGGLISSKAEPSAHPPFTQRKCEACHSKRPTAKLRDPPQTYCLECHNGEVAPDPRAGLEWLHGPVAAVDCLRCHEAHESRQPHLVRDVGIEVCTQCHTEKAPTPEQQEAGLAPPEWPLCYTCHEPHGAQTHALLRSEISGLLVPARPDGEERQPIVAPQDPLCVACHDGRTAPSPTVGLSWIHGPVATGACVACHAPHHPTDRPHFLRREGDALCTFCHQNFPMPSGPHADLGRRQCLDCHGPHGEASAPANAGGK